MAESMAGLSRSHRCTEVGRENIGEKVTVMGWVQKRRNLGSLIFVDLRDRSGLLQLVFDEDTLSGEDYEKANSLRNEYVIAAAGEVQKRSAAVNENLKTGDIEIKVTDLRILSESKNAAISCGCGTDRKRRTAAQIPLPGFEKTEPSKESPREEPGNKSGKRLFSRRRIFGD